LRGIGTDYIGAFPVATAEPGTFWMLGISGVLIALGSLRNRLLS
jgi:hypothetical protein